MELTKRLMKIATLMIFLSSFLLFAKALPLIKITPAYEEELKIYTGEEGKFLIYFLPEDDENIFVHLEVENGVFVESGEEKKELFFQVELKKGVLKKKKIIVKSYDPGKHIVKAEIGKDKYVEELKSYFIVEESPLFVDFTFDKDHVEPNEEDKIIFHIINRKNEELSDIRVYFIFPKLFMHENAEITVEKLKGNEKILNKTISFVTPGKEGEYFIKCVYSFKKAGNTHIITIKKRLVVRSLKKYLYALLLLVTFVLAYLIYIRIKRSKENKEK